MKNHIPTSVGRTEKERRNRRIKGRAKCVILEGLCSHRGGGQMEAWLGIEMSPCQWVRQQSVEFIAYHSMQSR